MKSYFRILSYARSHFSRGVLATFFLLLYNFFSIFSITLLVPFLQVLFSGQADLAARAAATGDDWKTQGYATIARWVLDYGQFTVLVWICGVMLLALILKNLFRYLSSWNIAPFEQSVVNNLRNRLFDHLSILSMNFYSGQKKGRIINVLVSDVQIVQESVVGTLQTMISDPLTMLLILFTMFVISWKLSLFTLLVLPVAALLIAVVGRSLRRKARQGQEKLGDLIAIMDEFISGIRIVKAFGAEEYERGRFARSNDHYRKLMVSLRRRSDLASPMTETLAVFVLVGVILYGGNLVMHGGLEASELIGLIALFGQFILPIKTFSGAIARIQKGLASFQRVEEFLAIPETVKQQKGALPVKEFKDRIVFENVGFSYEQEEVLHEIGIELRKGETVALVGPSGGGKSTLADLLPRFYDPTKGRILLDGQDLRMLDAADLRRLIGVVTQEGILFNDTVIHNIAYGDSRPDRARVEQAARVAHAHDFIQALPEGYDTIIGERGTKLSGGQRQRLAIARAIYKDAPILILDEATSALDSESEKLVQDALDRLVKNRTSLVIAHRLSTIVHASRIYVIEKGRVVETGTHEELLALNGVYRKLYDLQFGA